MKKFLQIMPCEPGWRAVFALEPQKPTDEIVLFTPLIGWALCEDERDEGFRSVEGLEAGDYIDSAEETGNFIGYAKPGDDAADWRSGARDHLAREEKCRLEREEKRKAKEMPVAFPKRFADAAGKVTLPKDLPPKSS